MSEHDSPEEEPRLDPLEMAEKDVYESGRAEDNVNTSGERNAESRTEPGRKRAARYDEIAELEFTSYSDEMTKLKGARLDQAQAVIEDEAALVILLSEFPIVFKRKKTTSADLFVLVRRKSRREAAHQLKIRLPGQVSRFDTWATVALAALHAPSVFLTLAHSGKLFDKFSGQHTSPVVWGGITAVSVLVSVSVVTIFGAGWQRVGRRQVDIDPGESGKIPWGVATAVVMVIFMLMDRQAFLSFGAMSRLFNQSETSPVLATVFGAALGAMYVGGVSSKAYSKGYNEPGNEAIDVFIEQKFVEDTLTFSKEHKTVIEALNEWCRKVEELDDIDARIVSCTEAYEKRERQLAKERPDTTIRLTPEEQLRNRQARAQSVSAVAKWRAKRNVAAIYGPRSAKRGRK